MYEYAWYIHRGKQYSPETSPDKYHPLIPTSTSQDSKFVIHSFIHSFIQICYHKKQPSAIAKGLSFSIRTCHTSRVLTPNLFFSSSLLPLELANSPVLLLNWIDFPRSRNRSEVVWGGLFEVLRFVSLSCSACSERKMSDWFRSGSLFLLRLASSSIRDFWTHSSS